MRGFLVLLVLALATPALAQPEPVDPPAPDAPVSPPEPTQPTKDDDFGPVLLIEQINIVGNTATQEELIRRALPIQTGDVLRASDKRLRVARFKVLALGYFRDVTLAMNKGSQRGQVIIEVRVVERGTVVLNRFARYQLGEGIEKKKENFAEEVAAQLK